MGSFEKEQSFRPGLHCVSPGDHRDPLPRQLLWTLAQLGAPSCCPCSCGFLPGFLFKVQSFGLSLGPGENTEKRRPSKCYSKFSHPRLPTLRLFNSALLLKYSQLLVSLIHQKKLFMSPLTSGFGGISRPSS